MVDAPPRWVRPAAAILGASGVAAGAFGAHALRGQVTPDYMHAWETAADYQLLHAVVLLAVSGWQSGFTSSRVRPWLVRSCYCFLSGVLIFSGSLFTLVLTGIGALGAITPLGGTALIVGWFLLLRAGLLNRDDGPGVPPRP